MKNDGSTLITIALYWWVYRCGCAGEGKLARARRTNCEYGPDKREQKKRKREHHLTMKYDVIFGGCSIAVDRPPFDVLRAKEKNTLLVRRTRDRASQPSKHR